MLAETAGRTWSTADAAKAEDLKLDAALRGAARKRWGFAGCLRQSDADMQRSILACFTCMSNFVRCVQASKGDTFNFK